MPDETCGEETADGTPCENSACREDGKCWIHTDIDEPADVGRPTKLNKERQESIASQVEQGKSLTSAARMNGVSRNAVYNWYEKGADQEEGVYAEFHDRLTRAYGFGENQYFKKIVQIAEENGDHRFLASLMKQRYPDSWGETETGVDADTVEITISERTKETWEGITQE